MYPRTRNARDNWNAVTDVSPAALVGAGLTTVLVPLAVAYLAGHQAIGGGFLLGIGLLHVLSRHSGREERPRRLANHGRTAEVPVWFEWLDVGQQPTADTSAD